MAMGVRLVFAFYAFLLFFPFCLLLSKFWFQGNIIVQLHGEMCRKLSAILSKIVEIFPILEDARPRSKSGIQALCSLHVALDKAKNLLLHCANCSKLYLAITRDSVVLKFKKAGCGLQESLRRVEDIVPQSIGCQIVEIIGKLEEATFVSDELEKQAGDDVIRLLQENKSIGDANDVDEIEIFHRAAMRLGITSSRAALTERRALKKLIERARHEEDKRKESIVMYLLSLMRKYSKHFRSELTDETDSQGSTPCSPSTSRAFEEGFGQRNSLCFDRQLSKLSSFNFKTSCTTATGMPVPPEELRCPISLQLMYDPVIISSGQTYERLCIEKWINDGHHTCPKTQQELTHLSLTPNYCVKGLITSWCEHNGLPVPGGPPDSLDLNHWRLATTEGEGTDSRSGDSIDSYKAKGFKGPPSEEAGIAEIFEGTSIGSVENVLQVCEVDVFERCKKLLSMLYADVNIRKLQETVEQIRLILKDDDEARIYMGANGFVEALVRYLRLAIEQGDEKAQNVGAMALFNLAVNNERNKEMMLLSGLLPLLEEMMTSNSAFESATAMYLNLSSLAEAKPVIGSSKVVYALVKLLKTDECSNQCKADALQTIYNLSSHPHNTPYLLSSGVVDGLHTLIERPFGPGDGTWVEKSMAVLVRLASNKSGKKEIVSTPGLVSTIAAVLDTGEPSEQEQAVWCLLILCNGDTSCSHMVLQEGVIPALVSLSIHGTQHGKEKAHKLLVLFREQRERDSSPSSSAQQQPHNAQVECNVDASSRVAADTKPLCKSATKRVGRTLSSMWKNKHFSVYQC